MKSHYLKLAFLLIASIFTAACSENDEPEIHPIRFSQQDYTIRFGIRSNIGFVDGGGVYELTASNPDVLGEFYIDNDVSSLVVFPKSIGESSLTIKDVIANSSVTLNITIENFYLSFIVDKIEGENTNHYLSVGNEIRFIRDDDNTKQLEVYRLDHLTHKEEYVADGFFEIDKSETNIFSLNMALHHNPTEELEGFSYTMGGDWEYLNMFDKYFEYNWDKSIASKSQPVKRINMILTDSFNGCKISCSLQPF